MTIVLKKIWAWMKHHWHIPVIAILALVAVFAGRGIKNKYFELMLKQRQRYKEEVDLINKENDKKEIKKEELTKKAEDAIKEIEEKHEVDLENLDKEKKKEISETVEKFKEKPEELAKEIARILSAEYLKKEKE